MCIAITKPIGVKVPSEQILKNCWNNNPDGAGFSFNYKGRVYIKKGFMTFDDFIKSFNKYNKIYDFDNCGMLLHFRIATHGAKDQSMTHPFPIVDDEGALKKIEYISDYSVIHNGIISLTSSATYKSNGLSDTAIFIKDYLTKIAQNKSWLRKKANIELIEKLIDSKMAILDKFGRIKMTSGFTEDNGIYYSNSTYKDGYARTFTKTTNNVKFTSYPSKYGREYYDTPSFYSSYYDNYEYEYDDVIADRVDDSKATSNINDYKRGLIGVMKVPSGSYVDASGIDIPEFITTDCQLRSEYDYYTDIDNIIYVAVEGKDNEVEYYYIGYGDVLNSSLQPIEFKVDKMIKNSSIQW